MSETANLKNKFEDIIDLSLGDPDIITDKSIIQTAFKDTKRDILDIQILQGIKN